MGRPTWHSIGTRFACVVAALCVAAPPLLAQRPARSSGAGAPRNATTNVRAEFANVLLNAGRYEEAAREFRALLGRDAGSFEYRLGLARALAWGNHPREAESELRLLASRRPQTAVIDSMLRSVRESYDPRASEAAGWVTADPWYARYRLALARALARERLPRLAIAHFDTLLLRGGVPGVVDGTSLTREMADAYVLAGDAAGGAATLRRALQAAPADTSLRHALAITLAGARRFTEAQAQLDTLLLTGPDAPLLLERARTRLALGDGGGAAADLTQSLATAPSVDAYLLLGELHRDRGEYREARSLYDAARARNAARSRNEPDLRHAVANASAQLAREERPVIAYTPALGADRGWQVSEEAAADNLGVAYSALSIARSFAVAPRTLLTTGVEYRQLAEHTSLRTFDASGYGASAGVSHEVALGEFLARAIVEGGTVYHAQVGAIAEWRAALGTWIGAWQLSAELASAAAYPSLFTAASLVDPQGDAPIVDRPTTFSLGGPLARIDAALSWQQSRLSDGNRRRTVQGYARYPLGSGLFVVYAGGATTFAERSTRYWDPARYITNAAGLEWAIRRPRGMSFAARALPAFASSVEAQHEGGSPFGTTLAPLAEHRAVQLSGSGELSYRARRWEGAAAMSYGRGRAGDYQRFGATVTLRIAP